MIRELFTRLSSTFHEQTAATRRECNVPMRVWFDPDHPTELASQKARAACITGEMIDISTTGLAFSVAAIRYQEKYLVGHERPLNIEIDLPNGKAFLRAIGKRYERDAGHLSTERFQVGVAITKINDNDRIKINDYIRGRYLKPKKTSPIGIHADQ